MNISPEEEEAFVQKMVDKLDEYLMLMFTLIESKDREQQHAATLLANIVYAAVDTYKLEGAIVAQAITSKLYHEGLLVLPPEIKKAIEQMHMDEAAQIPKKKLH